MCAFIDEFGWLKNEMNISGKNLSNKRTKND
jgi:hypothetical protein